MHTRSSRNNNSVVFKFSNLAGIWAFRVENQQLVLVTNALISDRTISLPCQLHALRCIQQHGVGVGAGLVPTLPVSIYLFFHSDDRRVILLYILMFIRFLWLCF